MGQFATVLRHVPQRQASFSPTRITPGVNSVVGSCAQMQKIVKRKAASSLRFHRCRLARKSDYLRACVLITHLAGNKTNQRAEKYDPEAKPDPGHQRKIVELKRGFASIGQDAGVINIQVFS